MKKLLVMCIVVLAIVFPRQEVSGGVTNIVYLEPSANLATVLSNAPNNSVFRLSAGRYPVVPSMVLSNGMGGINLFNKSNITIEGIPGLTVVDGASALGEVLYVTNCSHVTIRGITMIGMVVTNYTLVSAIGHVWAGFSLYAVDNVTVENCRFIDGHDHGIHDMGAQPNWNTISTNNIVIRSNYFDNFGSFRTNEVVAFDGTAVVPTGWLVTDNEFVNCLRCVEPYSESDDSPNLFFNCIIRSNRMINTLDVAILTAGSTNGHRLLVEGNYIYNEPGYSRRGTNCHIDGMGIFLNGGDGHVIRNNRIVNAPYAGIQIGGGSRTINDIVVEGNRIENVDSQSQGFGIYTYSTAGPTIRNILIRNNWITKAKNHAMHLLSLGNGVVVSNTIVDPVSTFGPAIHLQTYLESFNTNVLIARNRISDTTAKMSSGIEVSAGNKSIRLEDNCIGAGVVGPIVNHAGAETVFTSRGIDCAATPVDVQINEWMAGNTSFLRDPADGDFDDWFELHNRNNFSLDLGGYYLTDVLSNKGKFRVPDARNYIIPPGGFLQVWADDESFQNSTNSAALHASFSLRLAGESLGLFAADGTEIDTVSFGRQTNNISEGFEPDGSGVRQFMSMPTPSTVNITLTTPVINGLTFSGATVSFSFNTTPGRKYRVEYRDLFQAIEWLQLGEDYEASDERIEFNDAVGTNVQRLYRVIKLP